MLSIDIKHRMITAEGLAHLVVKTAIQPGELACLFGPSGVGKTTLLRLIAGLTTPDSGTIRFNDTVWFDSESEINLQTRHRNVGFMFQDYALFPHLSVANNIRFALAEKDTARLEELLDLFELKGLSQRKPHQLSGGQKQRVALARVLAFKPALLLLDEPLAALDNTLRTSLQDAILKAHTSLDATTLMVSHDILEVARLATSVISMEYDRVMRYDQPGDVINDWLAKQAAALQGTLHQPLLRPTADGLH